MRPPHTQIIIFHNEPPFHSCIYYSTIGDEYQKFKLITSFSNSDLPISYYTINLPVFNLNHAINYERNAAERGVISAVILLLVVRFI